MKRVNRTIISALAGFCLATTSAPARPTHPPPSITIIPGHYGGPTQPDGNTVVFEDADGLVVVDTGRHPEHQERILVVARSRGKPIRAIVNTHWHLDHSGGNARIRAVFPAARLYTSEAVRGALDGFLAQGLANGRRAYADPATSARQKAELKLGIDAIEGRRNLIPDEPVTGPRTIPYRRLGLRLDIQPNAATQADTTVYDPSTRTLVVGDLVVIPAPFFDTACADGWRRALDRIAGLPFDRLVPGHGPVMSRRDFAIYRSAFDRLVDCAEGGLPNRTCIAGWHRDAARFLPTTVERDQAAELLDYYIDRVIRSPGKQAEFCRPLARGAAS